MAEDPMADDLTIRSAVDGDLPQLTDLYNHYIVNTAATFDLVPHTIETKRQWFAGFADAGPYRVMVAAEPDGRIVGHSYSSPLYPKAAYRSSVATSVYLLPDEVGRGLGTRLWNALYEELRQVDDLHQLFALITLPNDASVALTESRGYTRSGIWKEAGHKFDRYWDVGFWQRPVRMDH